MLKLDFRKNFSKIWTIENNNLVDTKIWCLRVTPKGPLSLGGTNRILASSYGLNFCHDFLKLFWKIEKLIIFMGYGFFFQLVPKNKSYAQISSKQGTGENKKKFKISISFFNFFSHILYFCLYSSFYLDLLWESYGQSCFSGN